MSPTERRLLTLIASLLYVAAVYGQLVQIVAHTREQSSNRVQFECRETYDNGTQATARDTELFLFNASKESVTSLLEREDITYDFSDGGVFSFDMTQAVEGYYFCSRDTGQGPLPSSALTVLARPRPEAVETNYERKVGESVTIRSGVGEGALAAHYTADFYKDRYIEVTNVSRGDDFSLTISSVELSDSGTYVPSVSIDIGNGEMYPVPYLPTITLTVYKSPIIEVAPTSVIENEGVAKISFTCIATGGPHLRISWFREDKNLTKFSPFHYNISNITTNEGTKIMSVVTVHRPNYIESGKFKCVATIMNGRDGADFRAESAADLTIIESEFHLKTTITEHQQIQLWVQLNNPISLYPVTAIVYFTPTANPDQRSQPVPTYSIVANTTLMVYQLESHDVPEKFREEDFYIQVALMVESVESSLVPNNLDMATTANLKEPTASDDCSQQQTNRLAIIVSGVVSAVISLVFAFGISFIALICYKCKSHLNEQKTERRKAMTAEERKTLREENERFREQMKHSEGKDRKMLKKQIEQNDGLIRGDGKENPE